MEREQSKKIIDKIKVFRQSFLATPEIYSGWYEILKDYRYEDVDKKLDEYFKDATNFGQYPDAYYLTKFLKTEEELELTKEVMSRCPLCKKEMPYNDLDKHFDRCSSIDYINTQCKKHLDRTFDKQKMWGMDDSTFDKFYIKVCEEIFKVMPDGLQKHLLENVILTYYGKEPKHDLKEMEGMI